MKPELKFSDARNELIATKGNVIVLGGPGSGKTTIALVKAGREICSGLLKPSQRILFLSFARATVARVAQHASAMLPASTFGLLEINTYHGFTWNILRSHSYLLRGGKDVKLLPPPEAAARLSDISGDSERTAEKRRLFDEEGLLHFDLFAGKASELLSRSKSLNKIIGGSYPIIILDEFQDTNQDEWELIKNLGMHSRILALADADQRIYEFRGADPKRIAEFIATFNPDTFDFGTENHRSNGTDIGVFGNDLLTGLNKTKEYRDVKIVSYGFYQGRHHLYPLKASVLQGMRRLIKDETKNWSLAILVPTKKLMFQVSDYLNTDIDDFPVISHEVALDSEAPALAAILIAGLLESGECGNDIAQKLLKNLCTHIRGRKGSKQPNQADIGMVVALEAFIATGKIRGPKKIRIIEAIKKIGEMRFQFKCTGDSSVDWLAVRALINEAGEEILSDVAEDAKYLRLLHKGAILRSRLGELWRTKGNYSGAEAAVRDALLQEHFSASVKDWRGIHVMTIHKSKGKEFSEVVIYEGAHQGRLLRANADASGMAQALLALRVGVTRAMKRATILTPRNDRCPFL